MFNVISIFISAMLYFCQCVIAADSCHSLDISESSLSCSIMKLQKKPMISA